MTTVSEKMLDALERLLSDERSRYVYHRCIERELPPRVSLTHLQHVQALESVLRAAGRNVTGFTTEQQKLIAKMDRYRKAS